MTFNIHNLIHDQKHVFKDFIPEVSYEGMTNRFMLLSSPCAGYSPGDIVAPTHFSGTRAYRSGAFVQGAPLYSPTPLMAGRGVVALHPDDGRLIYGTVLYDQRTLADAFDHNGRLSPSDRIVVDHYAPGWWIPENLRPVEGDSEGTIATRWQAMLTEVKYQRVLTRLVDEGVARHWGDHLREVINGLDDITIPQQQYDAVVSTVVHILDDGSVSTRQREAVEGLRERGIEAYSQGTFSAVTMSVHTTGTHAQVMDEDEETVKVGRTEVRTALINALGSDSRPFREFEEERSTRPYLNHLAFHQHTSI